MKLIIISGRSGSGKSTVLHILEDRGYYCIDNLPASLLPSLVQRVSQQPNEVSQLAVSIDARNLSADLEQVPAILADLKRKNIHTDIVFLDANSQTLLKRFSESRRKHPLSSPSLGLKQAIDKESELLEGIALLATLSMDTSKMSLHQLRDSIKARLITQTESGIALSFQSFGYKNGIPMDADIVYDVRCLPNPYWITSLRVLTGQDESVKAYLRSQSEVKEMCSDITQYLQKWLSRFELNNRSYITVAIGCTGGQHRSVFVCEELAATFTESLKNVQIKHRELTPE